MKAYSNMTKNYADEIEKSESPVSLMTEKEMILAIMSAVMVIGMAILICQCNRKRSEQDSLEEPDPKTMTSRDVSLELLV